MKLLKEYNPRIPYSCTKTPYRAQEHVLPSVWKTGRMLGCPLISGLTTQVHVGLGGTRIHKSAPSFESAAAACVCAWGDGPQDPSESRHQAYLGLASWGSEDIYTSVLAESYPSPRVVLSSMILWLMYVLPHEMCYFLHDSVINVPVASRDVLFPWIKDWRGALRSQHAW